MLPVQPVISETLSVEVSWGLYPFSGKVFGGYSSVASGLWGARSREIQRSILLLLEAWSSPGGSLFSPAAFWSGPTKFVARAFQMGSGRIHFCKNGFSRNPSGMRLGLPEQLFCRRTSDLFDSGLYVTTAAAHKLNKLSKAARLVRLGALIPGFTNLPWRLHFCVFRMCFAHGAAMLEWPKCRRRISWRILWLRWSFKSTLGGSDQLVPGVYLLNLEVILAEMAFYFQERGNIFHNIVKD